MTPASPTTSSYRGRLAPSPTGYLHLGHARTFWVAQERARARGGQMILRNEDNDAVRFKLDFVAAMLEDLCWFGFDWQEGPDCGGPFGPYNQSERTPLYRAALDRLRAAGFVYPCTCSRKDIQSAARAPHAADDETLYPGTCRPVVGSKLPVEGYRLNEAGRSGEAVNPRTGNPPNLRFRVPDGEVITFEDGHFGPQRFVAGEDFGDFVVWRFDGVPSYQLAVVVDDAAMRITEVVRGADLLRSTARQLLLYRALGLTPPAFYHCPLLTDAQGVRLAKRHDALSLRAMREQGSNPAALRQSWAGESL